MKWTPKTFGGRPSWESDCGTYDVVDCSDRRKQKPFRLLSTAHENPDGTPKFWDFDTEAAAKDYAEFI
jgi:hypothetical protein